MIPAPLAAVMLHTARLARESRRVPFAVGEVLEYGGKYNLTPFLGNVGSGTLTVVGIDTLHGVPAWHFRLSTQVQALGLYKNVTLLESWTAVSPFESMRFVHKVNENGHQYSDDDFHIWPDSGFFRNHDDSVTHATPADPLDDLAFLYYIRSMDFKTGAVYRIPRYFHADKNPVVLTVLGREWVDMPDGSRRQCWVVHPLVNDNNGIFSAKADTRVWISDDGVRVPVQLKFAVHPGTVTLQLRKISHGP
jgi:hypothetical protein